MILPRFAGKEINPLCWALRIIGVIQDYYHDAPKWETRPMILQYKGFGTKLSELNYRTWPGKYLSVKINGNDIESSLSIIENSWESHFPEVHFDYFFWINFIINSIVKTGNPETSSGFSVL